jgi:hypothetical protein
MILRPKRKEKGFRGGVGLRVVKEAQSRPFLCSPPIEFGGTGKCGNSQLEMSHVHPLLFVQRHRLTRVLQHINI